MKNLTQNVTKNGEQVTVSPINNSVLSMLSSSTVMPTSYLVVTGRSSIYRIIMEGDNIPLLSQNGPYFDTSSYSNMTAVTGDSATLKCRVHNLGNKTVRFHYLRSPSKIGRKFENKK